MQLFSASKYFLSLLKSLRHPFQGTLCYPGILFLVLFFTSPFIHYIWTVILGMNRIIISFARVHRFSLTLFQSWIMCQLCTQLCHMDNKWLVFQGSTRRNWSGCAQSTLVVDLPDSTVMKVCCPYHVMECMLILIKEVPVFNICACVLLSLFNTFLLIPFIFACY